MVKAAEEFLKLETEAYRLGDYRDAITDFSEAVCLQPDTADAYRGRRWAKHGLKDSQSSIADYSEAIRLQPDNVNTYIGRGTAKRELGKARSQISMKPPARLRHCL